MPEEVLLLLQAHALLAQVVDHPVVDADHGVDVRVADFEEPRGELALAQHLRALAYGYQRARQPGDDGDADGERHDEDDLDADKPEDVLLQQPPGQGGEHGVDDDQVDDEAAPQVHGLIPYFSKRR